MPVYWLTCMLIMSEDVKAIADSEIREKMKLRLVSLPTISKFFQPNMEKAQIEKENRTLFIK